MMGRRHSEKLLARRDCGEIPCKDCRYVRVKAGNQYCDWFKSSSVCSLHTLNLNDNDPDNRLPDKRNKIIKLLDRFHLRDKRARKEYVSRSAI